MEGIKGKGRLRLPARASVWYILSSAVARGVGMLGTPIFTRLLTPGEYGLYPLYNTWFSLISALLTLELTGGVIMRGLQKYEGRRAEFLSSAMGLCILTTVVGGALILAFSAPFERLTGLGAPLFFVMLLHVILNGAISFFCARERFSYSYKSVALVNLASAFGIPLISIGLILLTPLRAEARVIGTVAVAVLIGIPLLTVIFRQGRKIFDFEIWRYLLKLALPLLPHYLAVAVIMRVGEITVERVFGVEALGKFSVSMSVGLSLTMISGGILSALGPWIMRRVAKGEIERIRRLTEILTRGMCCVCLLVLSVAPETVAIVTPPEYRECLPAVYPMALSVVPMLLSSAMTSGQTYYERTAISSLPSVAAAILSVTLSLTVLPHLDYRFASLLVLLSYLLMAGLNALIFKRLAGEYPVYMKKTALSLGVTLLYAALLFFFRRVFLSRLLLALPLIPMLALTARAAWKEAKE